MGISGISITILIAKYYGAAFLGIFNLTYSIYTVLSQLVAGGIHFSVLKFVSEIKDDKNLLSIIHNSAFFLTVIISCLLTFIIFLSRDIFGIVFNVNGLNVSILYILPGLLFFAINKVNFAFHNALRDMKLFAVLLAMRFLIMLVSLIVFIKLNVDGLKLSAIFSFSEIMIFVLFIPFSLKRIQINYFEGFAKWVKLHLVFGFKSAIGNILIDINTRIDILVLGLFVSEKSIGIYGFAIMIVEGFSQLSLVFRNNINPVLTKYRIDKSDKQLESLIKKGRNWYYVSVIPLCIIMIIIYPFIINILNLDKIYLEGQLAFNILMFGLIFSIGYHPFQMILNQTGFPGYQSVFFSSVFLTNLILNFLFIPLMGINGAALATAITFVSIILYLKILTYKSLRIKI